MTPVPIQVSIVMTPSANSDDATIRVVTLAMAPDGPREMKAPAITARLLHQAMQMTLMGVPLLVEAPLVTTANKAIEDAVKNGHNRLRVLGPHDTP